MCKKEFRLFYFPDVISFYSDDTPDCDLEGIDKTPLIESVEDPSIYCDDSPTYKNY